MSDATARLNVYGRWLLVQRVLKDNWSPAAAAESAGVSRATAYKWLTRYRLEGEAGLEDRSSRPLRSPRRTRAHVEKRVLRMRQRQKLGPHRISARTGVPASTVYMLLRRNGLHRLAWMDRPTGRLIRRYEREAPGDLGHMDTKKLAKIPRGGGHRMLGRELGPHDTGVGYEYVHSLLDDHSRLAYSEIHDDEKAETCTAFLIRAAAWFALRGIRFRELITDNARMYRDSHLFRAAARDLGIRQIFTRPRRPQTNGKVERYHRTFLDEWAYVRLYRSNAERRRLLAVWLHRYNYHRSHTALRGLPPIARVNNLSGNYS